MIKGMTGFGYASLSSGNIRGFVEVKSVNHRYLDVGYYLPMGFASVENKIRDLLRRRIERGRITASLKITNKPGMTIGFNREVAQKYLQKSRTLKKELYLKGDLSLAEVIHLPGVLESKETTIKPEVLWPVIERSINVALASMLNMRKREGQSLCADSKDKLRRMLLQIKKIKSREKNIIRAKKRKLNKEEFVAFLKSDDINEEVARLIHHVEEFKRLLKLNGAVGKKLDFIAQEMQRETNTIGSKIQDKIISNAVIALKTKIEKLREQAQNIE